VLGATKLLGQTRFHGVSTMPLSLNLRHDLKRMSDAQLAERLERTWQTYSEAEAEAWPYKLLASFRGPFRHPLAYPFFSWVGVGSALSFTFGPSFGFSIGGLLSKRFRTLMRMHLAFCRSTRHHRRDKASCRKSLASRYPFATLGPPDLPSPSLPAPRGARGAGVRWSATVLRALGQMPRRQGGR
jgi:hypothetical protein